jgi:hypothetical protein
MNDEDVRRRQQAADDDERHRQANEDKVSNIYLLAEGYLRPPVLRGLRNQKISPLKAARIKYAEIFRRSHQDIGIDIEIKKAFEEWLSEPVPLRVRPDLVLALLLREGFAGRGRGQQLSVYERRLDAREIERFKARRKQLKAELIAEGTPRAFATREAEDGAATESSERSGLSIEQIRGLRPHRKRRRKTRAQIGK